MKLVYYYVIVLCFPLLAFAHPGNTDSYGCHTCKTNCPKWGLSYGEYHCHNAKQAYQPEEPIKSHYSETGGFTTPAPEYKNSATNILNKEAVGEKELNNKSESTKNESDDGGGAEDRGEGKSAYGGHGRRRR